MRKLKRFVKKKFLIFEKKGNIAGKIYRKAVTKKRNDRYAKYAHLPINENLIVFECFMGRKYADSPKAIYEYLLKTKGYENYQFVWCFRDSTMNESEQVIDNERTSIVRWGSEEYYKTYATAKYWFTNARIPEEIQKRDGQVYTQCWHGTPLKHIGLDIDTEATESKETTKKVITGDAKRYSYMVSPSKYCSEKYISAFGLKELGKENIVIEQGYPRNDYLTNASKQDIKRVKDNLGISGKKVILYAPTFREDQRNEQGYFQENLINFDKLKNELDEDYVILFRAHYYIANEFDFEKYQGLVIDTSKYPEINDLYLVSDMLITDYSSVFFDYGILKRPILFYMYDLKYYKNDLRGMYLSIDELPGPVATNETQLIKMLKTKDDWFNGKENKNKYKAFSERFTYLEDGHATQRVVDRILEK